jgi:dienelactone hydrolase
MSSIVGTIQSAGRSVQFPAGGLALMADLQVPLDASGVVLFCQVSGRHSARARFIADALERHGFATMLVDLLTREEEAIDVQTGQYRLDIDLLAGRILAATEWLSEQPETRELPLGYFGVSVGAAAAMVAASRLSSRVAAIVCRGGRIDFCTAALPGVHAPTLLIVGSRDHWVLQVNTAALADLKCRKRLDVVPGAAHLFKEPGAIDAVARLTCEWFTRWLPSDAGVTRRA